LSPPPAKKTIDWLRPAEEQEGLKRYVETLRERWRIVVVSTFLTTLIAVIYIVTASKTYEASSNILVTPVTGSDPVAISLGLLRESSDPTRDVQTASQLIANIDVARRAEKKLENGKSAESLLRSVSAEPVANSNIVAVTATEDSPEEAQEVANVFAEASVGDRTATMHKQIEERLPHLEEIAENDQVGADENQGEGGVSVTGEIAELQALAIGPDPTLRVQTQAALPTGQASPKKKLSIIAGILAGLIIGIGGAFALQVLDPRLRRESQLRRLYRLPVLARVPRAHRAGRQPLGPGEGSAFIEEAYRTLRATLSGSRAWSGGGGKGSRSGARMILVTGSSPSEGKTTTAVNLASSLALLGARVILVEADLRRPVLSKVFNVHPETGVVSVLIERAELADSLVYTSVSGYQLGLLVAEPDFREGWVTDLFSTHSAEQMMAELRSMADYVVIDSPPLNEVVDALPLAIAADDVVITARLGRTRLDKLHELGELLEENEVTPAGFVLVGAPRPSNNQNHYARTTPARRRVKPASSPPPKKPSSTAT
jgi:succinoglycan biosynthesis transport protein ExoP